VLLHFWAFQTAMAVVQLKGLHRHQPDFSSAHLETLAINVDVPNQLPSARSFAARARLLFPILFATEEVAGIYNIVYRHLFDRRRDLAIPSSFLLDREGVIVKVYQGELDPKQVLADVQSIPTSRDSRMQKALPFPGTTYQSPFLRNAFTYGVAMYQHGYLEQAEASFQQVVATNPADADGYYNLGTLALRRNDFLQGRRYLERALELRPDYPEALNNLGMIAAQGGRPDEAIRNFERSLLLRPRYATALLNLGNVYRRKGAYANAQEVLLRASGIQPDDPEVNYSIGMLFAQQGELGPASEYLEKAIALKPDYPEALNNLGVIFVRNHEESKAEEQFKAGIRSAPSYDQSYLNLARLYTLEGDKQRARDVLAALLKLQPHNPAVAEELDKLK
jgi:Flp pilus assembly protein TadD/peroxiredoxin